MGHYGQGDPHLYKYNISTHTESSVDVGCSVAGIAVDQETSLVYVTTYGDYGETNYPDPPEDRLMIYDSNLVKQDWESGDIGNPAGICVPAGEVSYKPPVFSLIKDNNDPNNNCVEPFNEIDNNYLIFDIYWDANGFADTNVMIIDKLPDDLEYYSSDPAADYNEPDNTVTWFLGDISGTDYGLVQITTKVNTQSCPCGKITNVAELEGDTYYSGEAAADVNVCFWSSDRIYVDKDANGYNNGTSWDNAYTELSDALQTAGNCAGSFKSVWVAEGTYKPVNEVDYYDEYKDKSFELVAGLGLFGHFAVINNSVYLCKSVSKITFFNLCQKNIELRIGFWYNTI